MTLDGDCDLFELPLVRHARSIAAEPSGKLDTATDYPILDRL